MTFLEQLIANLRLADVLDVCVVAVLLHLVLSWFRQRSARSLAIGLTLLAGLYLCARLLDMYLTLMFFHVGFTAILVLLIVVYQQDIRRVLERLSLVGWRTTRAATATRELVDTLVESAVALSDQQTGALLVFEAREPLERHVRGGVPVDGRLSLPLLCSIFHPASPGHDGAVVIRNQRIDKLGVHLPLSKNLPEIGRRGTRHAAALGLAERCDALVLVVSEERGTLMIAEDEQLREVHTAELTTRLQQFFDELAHPGKDPARLRDAWVSMGTKLAALALAVSLWLVFAYRVETIQRTFVVPIEYRSLPDNWVIDEPRPTYAELTLSGSERAFDVLDVNALGVSFDLGHIRADTPYWLRTESHLKNVPRELQVNQVTPREVSITARPPAPDSSGS